MTSIWQEPCRDPLLTVHKVQVYRDGAHVLQGVSMKLGHELLAVVGRNGMGKSTLCESIMGLLPIHSGSIGLGDADITGLRPHEIARRGIGYVPQGRRVFASLSVAEHLTLGAARRTGHPWPVDRIYETFPRLAIRRKNRGSELSGGEQQMLAIARALVQDPRLLIMDEPTEGLAPIVVHQLVSVFRGIVADGVGLLLVEQNLAVAAALAERIVVMVNGCVALETSAAHLQASEELQRRYLGIGCVPVSKGGVDDRAGGTESGSAARSIVSG